MRGSLDRLLASVVAALLLGLGLPWLNACAPASLLPETDAVPLFNVGSAESGAFGAGDVYSHDIYSPAPGNLPLSIGGCESSDERLTHLARQAAVRALEKAPAEPLSEALDRTGVPQVWPRGFTLEFAANAGVPSQAAETWLASVPHLGGWRCGVALSADATSGRRVLSVIAVEVLAELAPVPRQARAGQWLPLEVRLARPVVAAQILVAGPDEAVYVLPSSLHGDLLRAQFVARQAGIFRIQVLLDFGAGPRPALEVASFVEVLPAPHRTSSPSANATPRDTPAAAAAALLARLNSARQRVQLPALNLVPELSRVAQAHAEDMARTGTLAHDVGDGPPTQRVLAAQLPVQWVGENVAQAFDADGAHETLWSSPSHRANLLHSRFTAVGIGAAPSSDGRTLWFCELFAALTNPEPLVTAPSGAPPTTY